MFSHPSTAEHSFVIKKKQRTVNVPDTTIAPCKVGERRTPKFHGCALEDPAAKQEIVQACKLDLAYVLIKLFGMSDDDPWPGWLGFNILLMLKKYLGYRTLATFHWLMFLQQNILHLRKY